MTTATDRGPDHQGATTFTETGGQRSSNELLSLSLSSAHTAQMAASAWHPSDDDLDVVIRWLREDVSASAPGSFHLLPGLSNVRCTHLEDGWVHLTFMDWPLLAARAVADRLLHPDALQVKAPVSGFPGVASPALEGFGWDDEPPAAVLARHGQSPEPDRGPQPSLQAAAPTPKASTALTPAVDWEDDLS